MLVAKFLNDAKIFLNEFRVIRIKKGKMECDVQEAFPFPTSTFREVSLQYGLSQKNKKQFTYDSSAFSKEIRKKYKIFVILQSDKGDVQDIWYTDDFSYIKYENYAREVFDKTVEAFQHGAEEEFVKVSDDLKFHIRPKGRNADDTFEFSNGKEITKRTFWANRNTVAELLQLFLPEIGNHL